MRFFEFKKPNPNPWRFPSKYPYILIEGPGKILSIKEEELIEIKSKEWQPSKIAYKISQKIKNSVTRTILLQLENENNFYDSVEDLPKPFIAELKGTAIEIIFDADREFEQFFILISNLRDNDGNGVLIEDDFDYHALLSLLDSGLYKINFSSVKSISFLKRNIWKRILKPIVKF